MQPKHRRPTPVGDILKNEYLVARGLTQTELARRMGISVQVLNSIACGRRRVNARLAIKLAKPLRTTPLFWMHAQVACDLWNATHARAK